MCCWFGRTSKLNKSHYCVFEENVIDTKIKGPNKIVNADDKEHMMIDFMLYCKNSYGLVGIFFHQLQNVNAIEEFMTYFGWNPFYIKRLDEIPLWLKN